MQRTCALLGVKIDVRRVEPLQFEVRIKDFDYDMIRFVYPSSLSPGNEQNNRWSSASAHSPGSFNFAGVNEPGGRRHDRRAARRDGRRTTSSPRCARSIAC